LLDDALHRAGIVAHDAAIARGIGHGHGQQRHLVAAGGIEQTLQRVGLGQRHITRQHHDQAIVLERRHGLLHGMAGAQLGLLAHKLQVHGAIRAIGGGDGSFHFRSTMARHHHGRARLELRSGVQHMLQQGATGQLLQHLGMAAFHAVPLPAAMTTMSRGAVILICGMKTA
jgi:hypothetical protein